MCLMVLYPLSYNSHSLIERFTLQGLKPRRLFYKPRIQVVNDSKSYQLFLNSQFWKYHTHLGNESPLYRGVGNTQFCGIWQPFPRPAERRFRSFFSAGIDGCSNKKTRVEMVKWINFGLYCRRRTIWFIKIRRCTQLRLLKICARTTHMSIFLDRSKRW